MGEESNKKPKPMVEIGGKPIIWHIMKRYSVYGINEFIICSGHLGNIIEDYFKECCENWKITVVYTGDNVMTGGRLKKIEKYVKDETFCFTYGDGVGDIDILKLIDFHKNNKTIATVTAIQPPGRFGTLDIAGNKITSFKEKPAGDGNWINGGFFVLEPAIFDYIEGDSTIWERTPLEKLAEEKELTAYKHAGFWQPLDTLRDKNYLEELWNSGNAPWKKW